MHVVCACFFTLLLAHFGSRETVRIRDAEGASNYRERQLDVRKRAPKNKDVVLVGGCWLGASWLAGVKGPAAGVGSSSLELRGAD